MLSGRHDVLVIGAGHNGLTAAAVLAARGRSVLVVERSAAVGGTAASHEFYDGHRSTGLHHDTTGISPEVVRELGLERHGFALREHPPDVLGLDTGLWLCGVPGRAAREIASISERDSRRFVEYRRFLHDSRAVLRRVLLGPPVNALDPDAGQLVELGRRGLQLRRLGGKKMMELLRLPPMPVADFLGEWFESEPLKALLALPAVAGTFSGPRSPGTTMNLLRTEAAAGAGARGGGPALVTALERAARKQGVEIRKEAAVRTIVVSDGRASGVVLEDGEEIPASVVCASCDPKRLLLEMLPRGAVPIRTLERIRGFRARGTTAQVLLALSRPPRFSARPDDPVEFARGGEQLNDLERAFDAIKYRRVAERPILDVHVPTVSDPGLAPEGGAVASVLVHFAPHDLAAGWSDAERERLGDRVVSMLEERAPGFRSSVIGGEVLAPVDLESRYGLTGGHVHHGEHALDQLLIRPIPECVRYATAVDGLYLGGSGAHPGGGLTCLPGFYAASAILAARHSS